MRTNGVSCLLMGGQACVLYGAAEFSRDTDLAILGDAENLAHLRRALEELEATCIAVPPFEQRYLEMGLAVHFRCQRPDVQHMRIDVMSRLRGVDPFASLWDRRSTFELPAGPIEALALPDLVKAKKTQHEKDWPMIARLLEANYFSNRAEPTPTQIAFWLRELRTPRLLEEVVEQFSEAVPAMAAERPLLQIALAGDHTPLRAALEEEKRQEQEEDARYWKPLRKELQRLRDERKPS